MPGSLRVANVEHVDGRPAAYPIYAYAQEYLDCVAKLIHAQEGVTPTLGEQREAGP